jgi:hypothetical protein
MLSIQNQEFKIVDNGFRNQSGDGLDFVLIEETH